MKYSINDPEYKRSNSENSTKKDKRNEISPTNSDILIPISLQPDVEDLRYLKILLILLDQIISVYTIILHDRI